MRPPMLANSRKGRSLAMSSGPPAQEFVLVGRERRDQGQRSVPLPHFGEVSETCVKATLGRGFSHDHCLAQFLCCVLSIRYGGLTVGIVRVHQEPNDSGGWHQLTQ